MTHYHAPSSLLLLPLLTALLSLPRLTSAGGTASPDDFNTTCINSANLPDRQQSAAFLDAYDRSGETTTISPGGWMLVDAGVCDNTLRVCSDFVDAVNNELQIFAFSFEPLGGRNDPVHIETTFVCEGCPQCVLTLGARTSATSLDSTTYPCGSSDSEQTHNFTQNQDFSQVNYSVSFDDTTNATQCVRIESYRIWQYQDCPAGVFELAYYSSRDPGVFNTSSGCVANAESGSLPQAGCSDESVWEAVPGSASCVCSAGFAPNSNLTACTQCGEGEFKETAGNEACQSCSIREVPNPGRTACICAEGYTEPDCSQCGEDYFIPGGDCVPCPSGSARAVGEDVGSCTCTGNLATASLSPTTSSSSDTCETCATGYYRASNEDPTDPCNLCDADYFMKGGKCVSCPDFSNRVLGSSADICVCEQNAATLVGGTSTSDAPCNDCIDGFSRPTPSEPCTGILLRFSETEYSVSESQVATLTVQAVPAPIGRHSITITITVPAALSASETELTFTDSRSSVAFEVTGYSDSVALQDQREFQVLFSTTADVNTDSNTARLLVTDDDAVRAMFEMTEYRVTEGAGTVEVCVTLSIEAAKNVTVRIDGMKTMERESGGDSAAELGSVSEELMVLASQTRVCRAFEVAEDSVVEEFDEQYRLTLKKVGPDDLLFTVSADEGTRVVITDNDESVDPESDSLPLGLVVGVCVGGAILALVLAFFCILCLCCWRFNVKRQGFYHTYEDEHTAPTMLRYSASLRSISSQSVLAAEGKRASQKENEFFV